MADLTGVLKELEQERSHLDQAIAVIGKLVGRNGAGGQSKAERPRRTLSGSSTPENFTRPEGAVGKDKTGGGTNARAHDEQSSTQQDCCRTARSLG